MNSTTKKLLIFGGIVAVIIIFIALKKKQDEELPQLDLGAIAGGKGPAVDQDSENGDQDSENGQGTDEENTFLHIGPVPENKVPYGGKLPSEFPQKGYGNSANRFTKVSFFDRMKC